MRYFSPKQKPDVITAELRVESMHSHYSAVTVNGREQSRGGVSGDELFAEQVTSTGEFAFLFNVFNGSSRTEFAAPVEAVVERRRLKRYDFRVRRENNTAWTWFFVGSAINPGYHGSVFVDGASGEVMRLVLQVSSDELDPATPVSEATITIDYDDVVIGPAGPQHVPVREENISCFRALLGCVREIVAFSNYHKFSVDTQIIIP